MNPCSPETLAKILDKRRTQLQAKGLSEAQIKTDLDHLKEMLANPTGYSQLVQKVLNVKRGLSETEQGEFNELKAKLMAGFDKGKSKAEDILGDSDARKFKILLYKSISGDRAAQIGNQAAPIDLMGVLAQREKELADAGNIRGARRMRLVRRKMERIDKQNTRLGRDYKKIKELDAELRSIEESLISYKTLLEEGTEGLAKETEKVKEKLSKIAERMGPLGQSLEAINEKIESSEKAQQRELKKKASDIKKQLDKLEKQKLEILSTLKGTLSRLREKAKDSPMGRAITKLEAERRRLISELSKFGVNRAVALNNIIDNAPATGRQLAMQLDEVSKDIDFKTQVISNLFKESNTVDAVVIGKLFGDNFVMQRVEKNKPLTRNDVDKLFSEYKALAFEYAGSRERFIMDMEFSDKVSLREISETSIDPETEGATIEEADGDYPIVPTLTMKEVGVLSNPGIIPPENLFSENEGEVLYGKLRSLLYRLETLRRLPQFGKFVDISFVSKIMSEIEKLDDVDPSILFKSAIQWDRGDTRNAHLSHAEMVSIAKSVLMDLGIDESVFNSREFTDPVKWAETAPVFSFDIETHLDSQGGIHTVILMDDGNTENYESVRSSSDGNLFTSEELMNVLLEIEDTQNQGKLLATFNGNGFDLLAMAETIGTLEARQLAARIVFRSVDIFQNLRAFDSTTSTDTTPKSKMYSLGNTADALNLLESKVGQSYMPTLWKKRSMGRAITIKDLSKIDNSKISEGEKEMIVDEVNALSESDAARLLYEYSMADGRLTIRTLNELRQRDGASVRIRNADGNIYSVTIKPTIPTWSLVSYQSPIFGGVEDAVSNWYALPEGRQMATAFDGVLPRDSSAKTVIDLDKAQPIIMSLMAIALEHSPNTRAFGKAMVDLAQRGVTPEEQAYLTAINIARENSEASVEINKTAYQKAGNRLPIGIRGINETGGRIPGINFAEGNQESQRNQYINSIIEGAIDQISKSRLTLKELAEVAGYKPKESTVSEGDFVFDLIVHTIKKYSSHKDFDIVDFGNGNIDFAIGNSLGRGVIQIITRTPQGFRKSLHSEEVMKKGTDAMRAEEIAKASEPAHKVNLSMVYRLPLLNEVNHIFPRSLSEIEAAYGDYRLRQRISHILQSPINTKEEATEIINAYMNQKENPDEVIAETSELLLQLLPNTNNRGMFNRLPDMDEYRRRAMEALLDLPELLMMWQHDSVTYAPGSKIFMSEDTKGRVFEDDALSPGSLSGTALLSGMGPLFAHVMTYPILTTDLVFKSLERGIAAYKKDAYSLSNYFDFNMNGVHHMAALTLMYLDKDGSALDKMLNEVEVVDKPEDRYKIAVDLLRDNLPKIEFEYIRRGDQKNAEQAKKLYEFLTSSDKNNNAAREAFKTAVIARLYMGGFPAVFKGIRDWMNETGNNLNGVDARFIAEHLMNQKGFLQMHILDSAIGNLDEKGRRLLSEKIANKLRNVYASTGWHTRLRQIAIKNGFTSTGESMFSLNQVEEALKERIRFIAMMEQRTEEEVAKTYEKRINAATEYMRKVGGKVSNNKQRKVGGKVSNDEQMRELNVILMGNEEAYKSTPILTALNALQRTPYRLRGTESEGIKGRVEEHSMLMSRDLEVMDLLGFEDFNIYFLMGLDSSGGRLYMHGHRHQPMNSKLSSIVRENTPDMKDDNPYAMWEFGRNNLGRLGREEAEAEIEKLIARHIALQLSKSYAPKFGGYSTDLENRQGFMTEWLRKSERENLAWARGMGEEATLPDNIRDIRRSNGGLLQNSARFLLDPSRNMSEALQAQYNPGSNLKGLLAFRAPYSDIPWEERGIFSLQEMFYNRELEETRKTRVQRPEREIATVNDVIPKESRGYKNRYKGSKAPYVYETPFDSTYEMTTGSSTRRIELRANNLMHVLEKFAVSNNYLDILESGDIAKLFTIWKITNAIVNPFLRKMERLKLKGGTIEEQMEYRDAQANVLTMYQDLTNLWSFHDDVSHESRSYLEFGKMIGIDGEKIKGMYYIDFLFYLAKQGINSLNPLALGFSPTNNLLATGDPAADNRDTRILTLTVQSLDSMQVIFNVLYEVVGREIATNFMKKVDPDSFDSLEKDGNGFVLLSSVPLEYQKSILDEIFKSERMRTDGQFDLYLFLYDFEGMQIGNKFDFDNFMEARVDTSTGKAPKVRSGGFIRFDTSRTNANAVYHLTPEDIANMFTQIQNQVLLNNAEIAASLGSEIGVATNENMKFMNAERRKFYEMQRLEYADQMDILALLHQRAGTKMRITNNTRMRGDFGLPLEVYDARYYVAGEDGDPRGTALDMAWGAKINQAIQLADMYGLEEEGIKLRSLLSLDDKYIVPAVLILSQVDGQNTISSKRRLRAYVGDVMNDAELNNLYSMAREFTEAYLSAVNRDEIRNPYFHAAKRYVELNGPIADIPNVLNSVLSSIGVTDITNLKEVTKAKKALDRANQQYNPDIRLMDEDVLALAEEDGLTSAFGIDGTKIEVSIQDLVNQGAISEETAELYKGMIGIILTHNEEFANNLSIILDPNMERAGKSLQIGDRFVIKLNPELLKKRASLEALDVFAHEISHIARMQHLETDGEVYQGFLTAFRTNSGKDAITDMVSTMFSGDRGEISQLIQHYTTNPEEFLAEWGAFILISRTINNKSVIDNVRRIRDKHIVADESASWWERAFNRIKRMTSTVVQRMQVFRNQNPEVMKLMDNAIEVMFNFGNTYSKSRALAEISTRSFSYPLTELPKGSSLLTEGDIQTLHYKIDLRRQLENGGTLSEDKIATLSSLVEETEEYISGSKSRTVLGQSTEDYLKYMNEMIGIEEGTTKVSKQPRTKAQEIALATFVLEKVATLRGRRGGELASIAKIISDMPNKSTRIRQWLTDFLYYGSSRKIGEAGIGGVYGIGGGNSSNITYASSEPILASLGFILDATKGSGQNVYGGAVGGVLQGLNYIQQWSRPVIRNSHRIRNTYQSKEAIIIERSAFDYLLYDQPESKDSLPLGHKLTDHMFEEAKKHAKLYATNMQNFVDVAQKYGTYTKSLIPPKDMLALRVNNTYFEKTTAETISTFTDALTKAYKNKILSNMRQDGIADSYSIYLSGGMFQIEGEIQTDKGTISSIQHFYYTINENMGGSKVLTQGQRLILDEIEEYASTLWAEERPNSKQEKANFKNKLKNSPYSSDFKDVESYLRDAAIRLLRKAKAGATYKEVFKSLESSKLDIVVNELRNRIDTSDTTSISLATDILDGRLPSVFPGSSSPPRYMRGSLEQMGYSVASLHARKHLMTQGHSTIIPDSSSLDLTAKDIFLENNGLTPEQGRILREGFTIDLRSIIVGMERNMARSAYNNKAIQDLTGVEGVSFAWLINAISKSKTDGDWDTVLKEVKRKHDLAIGAATIIDETEGSGTENMAVKVADVFTTALWGGNRNAATLLNEGAISTATSVMFGGNTVALYKDLLTGMAGLFVNVFSRKYGNRLLNSSMWSVVPDALFDTDTATRGVMEHHLVDYDEVPLDARERLGMNRQNLGAVGASLWKRLRDSHLIAEPALRAALMRQGQRQLLKRLGKMDSYLEFIENYEGPKNQEMYENAIRELGTERILDLAGTEKVMLQLMWESGVLAKKNIAAIKYIIKRFGTSKQGLTRREFLDIGNIQIMMEMELNRKLWEEIPESGGLIKNDLYEALAAIGRFQKAYARQSIVEGNTLDRPTKGDPRSFLFNLYRSFPKLFVTQFALETYGRTTPMLLAGRLIIASAMDILYNFALMLVAGAISDDDLERIARGDINGDDITKIASVVARNPLISNRMLTGTLAQLAIIGGSSIATGKNQFTNPSIIAAGLPPAGMAVASGVSRAGRIVHDATNGDGNFDSASLADLFLRIIPTIGPTVRYGITRSIDPNYGKKGKSRSQSNGSAFSPVSMANHIMDQESMDEYKLVRDLLTELFPTGYNNLAKSIPPFMDAQMPPVGQTQPQATKTPQTPQSPTQGNTVAPTQTQVPTPPEGGSRAATPATPPTL